MTDDDLRELYNIAYEEGYFDDFRKRAREMLAPPSQAENRGEEASQTDAEALYEAWNAAIAKGEEK